MPGLTRADVEHVALLARLALTDDELERFTEQLGVILDHAAQVAALDTAGVEPTAHPLPLVNVLRGDDGPDAIRGGAGPDSIYGGAGTDELIGGPGADHLHSQDTYRDKVQCGAGYDSVDRDRRDAVDRHCERRY